MSENRLEQIRRDWKENYGMALANGDIDWFISEVERLRGLNHAQHYEYERLEATIAALRHEANMLREALAIYGRHSDDCSRNNTCLGCDSDRYLLPHTHDSPGFGQCICDFKKALTTPQPSVCTDPDCDGTPHEGGANDA